MAGALRNLSALLLLLLLLGCGAAVAQSPAGDGEPTAVVTPAPPPPDDDGQADPSDPEASIERAGIRWRASRALGLPYRNGRLVDGVQLPEEGRDFFTWDPALRQSPDRGWRRWGTDALVRTTLRVLREFRSAHPDAPRVGIGDLSRPYGGYFGARYGGLGHSSHQNGLDVDVYYPRRDGRERAVTRAAEVDRALAQDLVDRFAEAGAVRIFVGWSLRLHGPRRIVRTLAHHDDHLHVRIQQPDN
jgi:murein endopeptidase